MAESYDLTLGAVFIAGMLAASLWGVSGLQTYSYFNSYSHDPKWLKGLVIATWSLDTLHQALISHANYYYMVTSWGESSTDTRIIWSVHAQMQVNAVLAFVIQSFFVFRVWKLSKQNVLLTTPVAVLTLSQLVAFMVYSGNIYANQINDLSRLALLKGLGIAINALTAGADVFLAITLTYLLCKSGTQFKRSDTMIKKLIILTVNTGLFTSLNALCALVAYLTSPDTFIFMIFFFIMARLYFNSLMANLNARKIVSGRKSYIESLSLGTLRTSNHTGSNRRVSFVGEEQPVHDISVKVDTVLETSGDSDHIASDGRKPILSI